MTAELNNDMERRVPTGAPLWVRWSLFAITQVGSPLLFAGVLCWYILQIQADYKQERAESAAKYERQYERVLLAFEANATGNVRLAQAIKELSDERRR